MRVALFALLCSLLMLVLSAIPADARCLTSQRPIQGQLAVMRVASEEGANLKGYQVELARPACADATDLDGAPVRLQGVRTVQILTSDVSGEHKLDSLIGEKIVVAGYIDMPDPARHTGNAVLSDAWLIAVPSTGEGMEAGGAFVPADTGEPDEDEPAAEEPPGTQIAVVGKDGAAKPYQAPPKSADRSDIEARLARFVTEFYLSGENISPDVIRGIYGKKVYYFGKPNVGLEAIVRDKQKYYTAWPSRSFELKPGTLDIRQMRGKGRVYEMTFVYDFSHASGKKTTAGTGYARLQIDLAEGKGKIIRESGKVIDRY